jgi:hypothetical protein
MRFFKVIPVRAGVAAAVAVLALSTTSPALASNAQRTGNTKALGVARLSSIGGEVAVRRADSDVTVAPKANAPLVAGDFLATGSKGRAEMQLDNATFVRAGAATQTRFARMDSRVGAVQVARGTVALSRLESSRITPELQTRLGTIRPQRAGLTRVTVLNNGNTLVTARSGSATIVTTRVTRVVMPGRTIVVSGTAANPVFANAPVVAVDNFDTWNEAQDRAEDANVGFGMAYPAIVGVNQLSSYGQWMNNPTYGQVWTPNNMPSNWAPYQNGQWVWEPSYGWTWVANEPWGWAPYHYGNWFNDASVPGNGWAWYPGSGAYPNYTAGASAYYPPNSPGYYPPATGYNGAPSYYYPGAQGYYPGAPISTNSALWVPAAVAFLDLLMGNNPTTDLTSGLLSSLLNPYGTSQYGGAYPYGGYPPNYSGGYPPPNYGSAYPSYPTYPQYNVGWVPLAPNEPMYPWWGNVVNPAAFAMQSIAQPIVTNNYYQTVSVTRVTKIYRNFRAPNAVTVVSARNFVAGRFTQRIPFSVAAARTTKFVVVKSVLPIVPTRANLRFTDRAVAAAAVPKVALFRTLPQVQRPPAFAVERARAAVVAQRAYRLKMPAAASRIVASELRTGASEQAHAATFRSTRFSPVAPVRPRVLPVNARPAPMHRPQPAPMRKPEQPAASQVHKPQPAPVPAHKPQPAAVPAHKPQPAAVPEHRPAATPVEHPAPPREVTTTRVERPRPAAVVHPAPEVAPRAARPVNVEAPRAAAPPREVREPRVAPQQAQPHPAAQHQAVPPRAAKPAASPDQKEKHAPTN